MLDSGLGTEPALRGARRTVGGPYIGDATRLGRRNVPPRRTRLPSEFDAPLVRRRLSIRKRQQLSAAVVAGEADGEERMSVVRIIDIEGHVPLSNGSRLSCGALKKDSFLNLRAPPASSAC